MSYKYKDDELLMLSGIQHIAFCERQWAMIHIEQCWQENVKTVEGKFLHERSDNPFEDETRNNKRVIRAVPIVSYSLGLIGKADVIEYIRKMNKDYWHSIQLEGREGYWRITPVEYKRGKSKRDDRDAVQLCAQGICLEEMLSINIEYGELYYAQTRQRERILFDSQIRDRVYQLSERMHKLFSEGITPKATKGKHCSMCSLVEPCHPRLTKKHKSVRNYINSYINSLGEKEENQ